MSAQASNRDCRSFLRQLAEHASAPTPLPAHAAACAACAQRLARARGLAQALREPPEFPSELRARSFFEGILERVIDEAEATPLARGLGREGVRIPAAVAGASVDPDRYAPQLVASLRSQAEAPEWLWQRTRLQVAAELRASGRRRWYRQASGLIAAASLLVAVTGWFWVSNGTRSQLDIVFVPVAEMPALDHPLAVLRRGASR